MREIKFRAWDKEQKKMVDELLITNDGEPLVVGEYETIKTGLTNGGKSGDGYVELMQYTGLKDKNGKEIYEGDILNVPNDLVGFYTTKVEWGLGFWKGFTQFEKQEVIGNIYENPELLTP